MVSDLEISEIQVGIHIYDPNQLATDKMANIILKYKFEVFERKEG